MVNLIAGRMGFQDWSGKEAAPRRHVMCHLCHACRGDQRQQCASRKREVLRWPIRVCFHEVCRCSTDLNSREKEAVEAQLKRRMPMAGRKSGVSGFLCGLSISWRNGDDPVIDFRCSSEDSRDS